MWTSAELKQRAKVALTGTYWKAFAISLIIAFVSGGGTGGYSFTNGFNNFGNSNDKEIMENFEINDGDIEINTDDFDTNNGDFPLERPGETAAILAFVGIFFGIFLVIFVIAVGFSVFVGNPVLVGGKKYFLGAAEAVNEEEQAKFNLLGHGFKGPHYLGVVKTMFLKDLYLFGWFLLFIIPSIVKGYAYAMVPYILADNPNIGVKRAIELSNQMTDGEKMDMFILDLSFIGWFILAAIPCGLGYYFLNPYYFSTHAELYRVLREKALDSNICSFEELGFSTPTEDNIEKIEGSEVESTITIENEDNKY